MHIIDADKLLAVIESGMALSKECLKTEPMNSKGEYDVLSDVIRRIDIFTYNQFKVIKDYVIKNMIDYEIN